MDVGLTVVGTLGILLQAKIKGLVAELFSYVRTRNHIQQDLPNQCRGERGPQKQGPAGL